MGSNPEGLSALPGVARSYGTDWGTWLRDLPPYTWLYDSGWLRRPQTAQEREEQQSHATWLRSQGIDMGALQEDARLRAQSPTVTMGNITNNITVNVGGSNADPKTIGEAAGNAVGSALRGVMADTPSLGSMAAP